MVINHLNPFGIMSISISSYYPSSSCIFLPKLRLFPKMEGKKPKKNICLVIQSDLLGWLSDPFKGLSDLQLGDEKVTLNHLVRIFVRHHSIFRALETTHFRLGAKYVWTTKTHPVFFRGALFRVDKLCPTNFYIPTWKLMMMKMEKNLRYPPRN